MKKEPSAISISVPIKTIEKKDNNSFAFMPPKTKEVLRIENDGKVFWLKNGKMTQAKIDKELAMAFSYVVTELAGLSVEKLIENIKKL